MNDPIKVGIIGTGAIAQVSHLPAWKRNEDAEIVALCDINKNKVQFVAEKYGVAHVFHDPEELLRLPELDAVDICTPTHTHMELAIAALSADKHVLVEKPMARNYQESERMVKEAERRGKHLMVAMNVRFRRDAHILQSFTAKGELGEIFYAKTGWLRRKERVVPRSWAVEKEMAGGGVFMDLGIQMLDVGLWLMGNPSPQSVKANIYNRVTQLPVEDSAAVFISLSNGATLTVEVSWTLLSDKDFFYTNLFGTHGAALLNPLRIHKELHGNLVNVTPARSETPANLYKKSYANEIEHFVCCLRGEATLISSGAENLSRMRIVDAVYESAQTGREVQL